VLILFLGKHHGPRHLQDVNLRQAITLLALLTVSTANGLTIVGYDPATNDRFASGYPSAPVPNTSASFIGAGLDFSGVGWNPLLVTQSFAMISDQYFVFANHYQPGSTMSFLSPTLLAANPGNPAAAVVSATVSATYRTNFVTIIGGQYFYGEQGDFSIGKLSTPLDHALGISSYPILLLSSLGDYVGLPTLMYGHNGTGSSTRLGTNTIDGYYNYDLSGNNIIDTNSIYMDYDTGFTGEALLQGGDSGSPTFVNWYGSLALVGTHSATGSDANGVSYSFDNFIPLHLAQMAALGIDFSVVPEPSRVMLLLLGACALLRRRHRAPRE